MEFIVTKIYDETNKQVYDEQEFREFVASLNEQGYWKKGCMENDISQVVGACERNGYKVEYPGKEEAETGDGSANGDM